MSLTATATSNYVEGADRVRRYQIVGDSAYPAATVGYDVLGPLTATAPAGATQSLPAIKRIIGVRHRTLASAQVGDVVLVDTYTGGIVSALRLFVLQRGSASELTAGTTTANLNVELVYEGY